MPVTDMGTPWTELTWLEVTFKVMTLSNILSNKVKIWFQKYDKNTENTALVLTSGRIGFLAKRKRDRQEPKVVFCGSTLEIEFNRIYYRHFQKYLGEMAIFSK